MEPPQIVNAPGFQVSFMAGGAVTHRPAGRRFHARLYLWTPLSVLRLHGCFIEDGASLPATISADFGLWVPEPSAPAGWEPPELPAESDVGLVKPSAFLPFLMAFRATVESGLPPEEQARKLNRLHLLNPAWKPFVRALRRPSDIFPEGAPELAPVWFCPHLQTQLEGLKPSLAADLFQAGFLTPAQVREAPDTTLLKVPGMNRGTLKRMRALPR